MSNFYQPTRTIFWEDSKYKGEEEELGMALFPQEEVFNYLAF